MEACSLERLLRWWFLAGWPQTSMAGASQATLYAQNVPSTPTHSGNGSMSAPPQEVVLLHEGENGALSSPNPGRVLAWHKATAAQLAAMTRSTSTLFSVIFVVVFGLSSMFLYFKIMSHGTQLGEFVSVQEAARQSLAKQLREEGARTCSGHLLDGAHCKPLTSLALGKVSMYSRACLMLIPWFLVCRRSPAQPSHEPGVP